MAVEDVTIRLCQIHYFELVYGDKLALKSGRLIDIGRCDRLWKGVH